MFTSLLNRIPEECLFTDTGRMKEIRSSSRKSSHNLSEVIQVRGSGPSVSKQQTSTSNPGSGKLPQTAQKKTSETNHVMNTPCHDIELVAQYVVFYQCAWLPSVHLYMHPSIHPSIQPASQPSIHPSIHPSHSLGGDIQTGVV